MKAMMVFVLTAVLCTSIHAAGGSSKESTGEDRLAAADRLYNKGLKHRDKAWSYEEKAAGAKAEKDREVYQASAKREFERAIDQFREATKQNSRHVEAFGSLGYALRKTGQFDDALKAYNRALKMEPEYAEALEYRAEAYLGLNRVEDAKADYAKLVTLDVGHARTFLKAAAVWAQASGQTTFAAWVAEEQGRLGPPEDGGW